MKIAFDIQLLLKNEITGIGWCADNIVKNLPHIKGNEYQINCFLPRNKGELRNRVDKYSLFGYRVKTCSWFNNVLYQLLSNFLYLPYSLFFGDDQDITVFFNYLVPPGVKGKKIVFIHDMVYKAYPKTVRGRTKYMLNLSLKKSTKRANHIVTVSQFSKSEIIKYLKIPESKISVVYNGVDLSIYHPYYTEEDINRVLEYYKLPRQYLLYLGTLEPRKNIVRLVQAYAKLKKDGNEIPKLVLAGGKGWMYENIFKTVETLNLENDVIFTGYVKQADAPILLRGAKVFLFPSIYEGFGMPPLEAMACGTPVLASNTASLPEVVGDAGILVDPFSIESIQQGMKLLLENKMVREELSKKGLERARQFTWANSLQGLQKVFETL